MRYGIGMRYWLAIAFGAITAVTAVGVAQILSGRTEQAFREHAEEIALGNAFFAARRLPPLDGDRQGLRRAVNRIATERRLALFVFDSGGNLLTPERSAQVELASIPEEGQARYQALIGQGPVVKSYGEGGATLVAMQLGPPTYPSGALVAYARRPEFAAGLGIAREKTTQAAILAAILGGVAGLLVAALITARLRGIASAAAAIESGDFERALRPRFGDELGALAEIIDRMRVRLRDSFSVLESERDRLHRLLERLHEGVLTVDASLRVEYANTSARQLLELEGDELPDPWAALSLRALAAKLFEPDATAVHARVAPDAEHAYSVVGIPAGAEGSAAVLVLTDISERERRERVQREFVANAAHELRTPLSVISGAVEVLQSGAKEIPDERDRFLEHIERESARLGRLARALLVLARAQTRAETLRLEPVELRPLLEQAAEEARPRVDVPVRVSCPPHLAVAAQPQLTEQIVSNLVDNAAKHTRRGEIALRARPLNGGVAIEVADTGEGIPAEEREAIFERFYRAGGRDRDGFGLGLAIVREAVRALGGTVDLESTPGRGTTVRVLLPAAEQRAA
ncbi:MAG: HAMP domain-containing protein [Thermoleophilia bacterium]|nr:HAMP domain-containing protein [Thermoleophilia bacterium]